MIDILTEQTFDAAIANGDFMMGESTRQHQQALLLTAAGEWRESPSVGVDLYGRLLDEVDSATIEAAIKRQFEGDGMTVVGVKKQANNIIAEAFYK